MWTIPGMAGDCRVAASPPDPAKAPGVVGPAHQDPADSIDAAGFEDREWVWKYGRSSRSCEDLPGGVREPIPPGPRAT